MLQAKKLNASMIAVVVLSVLLAIAVATGATMAWFASGASSSGELGLSGAVVISLTGDASGETLAFEHTELVPSRPVPINVGATLTQTNTPSLVRARFLLEPLGDYTTDLVTSNTSLYEEIYEEFFGFLNFDTGVVAGADYEWGLHTHEGETWYYLGFAGGETGDVLEIVTGEDDLDIVIIDDAVRTVPHYWGNEYAKAQFTVTLQIEAVQAEFYQAGAAEPEFDGDRVPLSIGNVAAFFENVFTTAGQTPVTPEADPGFNL